MLMIILAEKDHTLYVSESSKSLVYFANIDSVAGPTYLSSINNSELLNFVQWVNNFEIETVLRGVIRRRLGYLINKKCFFTYKTTILRGVFCPSVNATLVFVPKKKTSRKQF